MAETLYINDEVKKSTKKLKHRVNLSNESRSD